MMRSSCWRGRVARSFSRAAGSYDALSPVQRGLGKALLERLPSRQFGAILDLGCGTGRLLEDLACRWPAAKLAGGDIAPGMIVRARERQCLEHATLLVLDALGPLPFPPGSFDLVVSSGMFQWLSWIHGREAALAAVREWAGLLRQGGVVGVAAFGPGTLRELEAAMKKALGAGRSLPSDRFAALDDLARSLSSCLAVRVAEGLVDVREYGSLLEMLRVLKATGVVPSSRVPLIRSRAALERVEAAYLEMFGSVKATYEMFVVTGEKR